MWRRWRPPVTGKVALISLALLSALTQACGRSQQAEASNRYALPDFELTALDGGTVGPEDFEGKITVFEFWATWCLPCHAQADILRRLYPEFNAVGVEFVAVNLGESESTIREFLERRPVPYPVLMDLREEVSVELGIYGLPTVMVVDRGGEVTYVSTGLTTASQLRELLEELVDQPSSNAA